jgi:hypothetical protein
MEGDLKVSPGTAMQVGYSFKAPQGPITVAPKIDFTIRCADGSTPTKDLWTIALPTQTYNVTSGDWWPTGDQHSSRSYQSDSVPVPDFCHKGKVRLDKGGMFTARFS